MASVRVRAFDASRARLTDRADVVVRDLAQSRVVARKLDVPAANNVLVPDLVAGRAYSVQVFPMRHRPVGVIHQALATRTVDVDVYCPIHPDRATPTYPSYKNLPAELKRVLKVSALESDDSATSPKGKKLYDGLDPVSAGGLFNLFAKMQHTVAGGPTMWSFVTDLYRVRGDRIFANVTVDFRDHVKSAVTAGAFEEVSGSLHHPPPGFDHAGSFKHTLFDVGVLQLTFFASQSSGTAGAAPAFKVDADIDDAGGLGHAFQVLRNWIGQRETHPYDIHQILTFSQRLSPGYQLDAS